MTRHRVHGPSGSLSYHKESGVNIRFLGGNCTPDMMSKPVSEGETHPVYEGDDHKLMAIPASIGGAHYRSLHSWLT